MQEERHKAAALKNAYVLMGRHQWELAIAFFLLGDDFSSAVNVCAKNLQDEQLAIVICRLVEGSGGPLERNLISNVLLPHSVEKGDNWLSSLLEVCHEYMSPFYLDFTISRIKVTILQLNYISSEFPVDVRELLSVYQ